MYRHKINYVCRGTRLLLFRWQQREAGRGGVWGACRQSLASHCLCFATNKVCISRHPASFISLVTEGRRGGLGVWCAVTLLQMSTRLKQELGQGGAISPRRRHDPQGVQQAVWHCCLSAQARGCRQVGRSGYLKQCDCTPHPAV